MSLPGGARPRGILHVGDDLTELAERCRVDQDLRRLRLRWDPPATATDTDGGHGRVHRTCLTVPPGRKQDQELMMLARPFRLLVAAPAVVLLVAGCAGSIAGTGTPASAPSPAVSRAPAENGIAALSESAILAKARAALRSAKSVRVRLAASDASKGAAFDIRYAGTKATGSFAAAPGQTLELRRLGESVYLKGSQRFWSENVGEGAATLLTGKWLKTSMTDERFGEMSQFLDLSKGGFLDPDGEIAKGGQKTIRGTAAIGLVDRSDGSILYIATTGPAYPLQTVPKPGAAGGSIDFLDYGKPVSVQAPPAELIIDTSKLPGS